MKMHPICQGNHLDLRSGVSRRDFMYVGMAGGLALTLPQLLKLQAANSVSSAMPAVEAFKPIADSIIHIYLPGGMAHQSLRTNPRNPNAPRNSSSRMWAFCVAFLPLTRL